MNTISLGARDALKTPALRPIRTIGFVGLGVMGEPMCINLARRAGIPVLAHDLRPEPLARASEAGVKPAESLRALAGAVDLVILSLPNGAAVEAVIAELSAGLTPGAVVVDTSTSPLDLTRRLHAELLEKGVTLVDAPVARTREAAMRGELSIMVGATEAVFAHLEPVLSTMGSDVTLCGEVGAGQVAKILNNMVLFMNVAALAEAIAVGRRAGVSPEVLLNTLSKGSGDSFALRNHGLKAMVPRQFPERAFSTRYAMKDLSYALAMAEASGVRLPGAELAMRHLRDAEAAGHGEEYWPVILEVIDPA
jgi:3-hydroxyisobutyrate dehydrogenase-like beta-hydroxyacid dehydrogenase